MSQEPKPKPEWCPTMHGNMAGYTPQWKHRGPVSKALNKYLVALEGGDDWTDVPYTVIRGAVSIKLADGSYVPVGIPFPRALPGILETIGLCGREQAMALAWSFAAQAAAAGAEIDVRAEAHELIYDLKAKPMPEKVAA